eukprot:CAMPEP_0182872808 /NCGR_PEP_ID=MMETSP0034_2-20130328/11940_1 /TAXON_ID=156128 /ORGANISM="Nephroselmis pyriformis, Strain CCMP717" /LENGTH=610 /DNA_ID=CAMNT_0025005417 /DNA_START=77 /DNA_END=1906 /DNA_ORIENTATION=-
MGFQVGCVVSAETHYQEFVCKICQDLVDNDPIHTHCTHVFCKACLEDWLKHLEEAGSAPSCPTCKANLVGDKLALLKSQSPLAWRVLASVQCSCPVGGCSWRGDYSQVADHLTNSQTHMGADPPSKAARTTAGAGPRTPGAGAGATAEETAEALKQQANEKFGQREYSDAIKLYSKAIVLAPSNPTYVCNRAAAWLMVGALRECVADCRAALAIDPSHAKAHVRLSKALCELGELSGAEEALARALELDPGNDEVIEEHGRVAQMQAMMQEAEELFGRGDFGHARALAAEVYSKTRSAAVACWVARCDVAQGRCDAAVRMLQQVIKADKSFTEAYVVRGRALYFSGDMGQAIAHVREALRQEPDLSGAQKLLKLIRQVDSYLTAARAAQHKREFAEAAARFHDAITAVCSEPMWGEPAARSTLIVAMLSERAAALFRLKEYQQSLDDCAKAIYYREDAKAAYLTRAQCLGALGRHKEALAGIEDLLRLLPTQDPQIHAAHEKALFNVKREERPDYYQILGVSKVASTMEIKQQYKKRAFECHPDKCKEQGGEAAKKAEEEFKLLQEALDILAGDEPMKRQLYDEGFAKEAIEERIQRASKAARESKRGHH